MRPYPSVSAAAIAAIVAGIVALVLPAQAAHAQIAIDREAVLLNPTQPAERVAQFVVQNSGVVQMQATVQLEDWEVDARGTSHWRKAGRVAGSCGNRVSVSPRVLHLAPGERQTVQVTVSGGARFDAECWSAAVVTPTAASALATTSVPVYVTPSGTTPEGEVRDMDVKGDSLDVLFANTGNVRTEVVGEVQVRNAADSLVMTIPIEATTVLAGATRSFRFAMPKLARGSYVLFAVMDFGGAELTAAQAALEIR